MPRVRSNRIRNRSATRDHFGEARRPRSPAAWVANRSASRAATLVYTLSFTFSTYSSGGITVLML